MNVRPSLLKTFLAVAHSRSISLAAAEVHLAQSSVSDQIQLLETELGASLFIRSRIGVELTSAGERLKTYAQEILSLTDEAGAAVAATALRTTGSLTIGALETIASMRLPQWLSSFRRSHPTVDLRLKIAGSGELLRKLEGSDIDVAFCFDKGELDERFVKRAMSEETLVLVGPPGRGSASIGDRLDVIAERGFVATEVGCVYRHLFERAFAEAGVASPRLAAEVDSIRTIVRLVAAGAGLALVPYVAAADALDNGDLVEIPWPGPTKTVSLIAVWRRRRVQPRALTQLLASARTAFAGIRSADARLRHAVSSPS